MSNARKGFASMTPERRRELGAKGGKNQDHRKLPQNFANREAGEKARLLRDFRRKFRARNEAAIQ
jgi:hypothetical protein